MKTQDAEMNAYDKPVEIADGIYWVGFWDEDSNLHCNPYLIIEGEEAALIDAGSRSDFSSVMMKILQTGINPHAIVRLIYHHYDPDLCGSIPNFETIIGRADLKIISHRANNIFIKYYGVSSAPTVYRKHEVGVSICYGPNTDLYSDAVRPCRREFCLL